MALKDMFQNIVTRGDGSTSNSNNNDGEKTGTIDGQNTAHWEQITIINSKIHFHLGSSLTNSIIHFYKSKNPEDLKQLKFL